MQKKKPRGNNPSALLKFCPALSAVLSAHRLRRPKAEARVKTGMFDLNGLTLQGRPGSNRQP